MTRFEKGELFVELEVDGASIRRRWGRIGHTDFARVDTYGDHPAALEAMQRQLRRFEHHGYHSGRHDPELEAVLKNAPDAQNNYLVYADWLLAHGDPRGLLIMTMASGKPFDELLDEHAMQFMPLTKYATYRWHLGFISSALVRKPTWGRMRQLFRHPSSLLLRTLIIRDMNAYDVRFEVPSWQAVLQHLPSTVTRIELEPQSALLPVWRDVPHVRDRVFALPS